MRRMALCFAGVLLFSVSCGDDVNPFDTEEPGDAGAAGDSAAGDGGANPAEAGAGGAGEPTGGTSVGGTVNPAGGSSPTGGTSLGGSSPGGGSAGTPAAAGDGGYAGEIGSTLGGAGGEGGVPTPVGGAAGESGSGGAEGGAGGTPGVPECTTDEPTSCTDESTVRLCEDGQYADVSCSEYCARSQRFAGACGGDGATCLCLEDEPCFRGTKALCDVCQPELDFARCTRAKFEALYDDCISAGEESVAVAACMNDYASTDVDGVISVANCALAVGVCVPQDE